MKSVLNEQDRRGLVARAARVTESTMPLWGKMSPGAMLAHLAQSVRMATGDIPVKSKKLPLRFFPLKQLGIYLLPMPKGLPTAPELMERSAEPIEQSRRDFEQLLADFPKRTSYAPHPAFGPMSRRAWGVLSYRHFDHHLRQFGV
jgi:hypothetical protein